MLLVCCGIGLLYQCKRQALALNDLALEVLIIVHGLPPRKAVACSDAFES